MLLRQRSEVATPTSAAPGPSGALRFADAPTSDKPGSGGAVDTPEPQGYYYTQLKAAS